MSSSRLALVFLGIIFLIIVILSSSKIAGALRNRFGKLLPINLSATIAPSPTLSLVPTIMVKSPTVAPVNRFMQGTNSRVVPTFPQTKGGITTYGEIPATGPEDLAWLLLGGSFAGGTYLLKLTRLPKKKK